MSGFVVWSVKKRRWIVKRKLWNVAHKQHDGLISFDSNYIECHLVIVFGDLVHGYCMGSFVTGINHV